MNNLADDIAKTHFHGIDDIDKVLERPLLYTSWLSKHYTLVQKEDLKLHLQAR